MSSKPFDGQATRVVWVPNLADPTRPTAQEIEAGIEIARDDTASPETFTFLPERTERYLVRRWPLDEDHEIVAIRELPEDDDSASS
jgi:hypothetical protein